MIKSCNFYIKRKIQVCIPQSLLDFSLMLIIMLTSLSKTIKELFSVLKCVFLDFDAVGWQGVQMLEQCLFLFFFFLSEIIIKNDF